MTGRSNSGQFRVDIGFVLLFSVRLTTAFTGAGSMREVLPPIPSQDASARMDLLADFERRVLGQTFLEAGRTSRLAVGRVALDALGEDSPTHADVYLVRHKSGVATWEAWMTAPTQTFNSPTWVNWLNAEAESSIVGQLWRALGPLNLELTGKSEWSGLYVPLILMELESEPLPSLVEHRGPDIVRLLFRDTSTLAFKPEVVSEELERDYCLRKNGMTLLSRRSGIDVRDRPPDTPRVDFPHPVPGQNFLPFFITVELLVLKHAVLQYLYDRLTKNVPTSVEELIALKEEVSDGLLEYSGVITNATRVTDAITADGEVLLGLGDMYEAVMNRLGAVNFTITTQSQRHMTLMEFWLTIVFGATEIGFLASSIATWYYRTGVAAVLAWTVGATTISALTLIAVLRSKIK